MACPWSVLCDPGAGTDLPRAIGVLGGSTGGGGSAQVLLEGWALWGLGVSLGESSIIQG